MITDSVNKHLVFIYKYITSTPKSLRSNMSKGVR